MKKVIVRPISAMSVFFIFLGFLCAGAASVFLINLPDEISEGDFKGILTYVFLIVVLVWLSIQMFYFIFKPNIQIRGNKLSITFWKNGTPFKRDQTFLQQIKLPEVKVQIIEINNLWNYGKFTLGDIEENLDTHSGFKQDFYIKGIKMPEELQSLQEVILFVTNDNEIAAVSGEVYSSKQLEYLFGMISLVSGVLPSGRITTISYSYSFGMDLLRSIILFIFGVLLILVLPVSTVFLEGLIISTHTPSYQSGYRTIYVVSMMLANMILLLFISTFDKTYDNDDSARKIRWISFFVAFILYIVFLVTFYLSVNK